VAHEIQLERPWQALPRELGTLLEGELAPIAEEIIRTIGASIPAYRRPMRGEFGRGVHAAIEQALLQFLDQVGRPAPPVRPGREVYLALGRGELRSGRTLDALQNAYRIGARIAWRRMAAVAREAGVDGPTQALLAEAIFAYIDELSAESVEGYAREQAADAGERERIHRLLIAAVVAPAASREELERLAAAADWPLPGRLAVLVCSHRSPGRLAAIIGDRAIAARIEDRVVALVPDPDAPGRRARIARSLGSRAAALGPVVSLERAHASLDRAVRCAALQADGTIPSAGLVDSDEHLAALVVHSDRPALHDLAERRLAPLRDLTRAQQARLRTTLAVWLRRQGSIRETATDLVVHPQTVRYRIARLRELFGDALDDPDARFELALALALPGEE